MRSPSARQAAAAAAAALGGLPVLPATYFNGSTLGTASTRGLGACCDVCRRRQGCAAYNWRPEPLGRNCVLFGAVYGVPRGTALCSAGIVKVPLAPPPPPPPPQLVSPRHQDGRGRKRRRRKQAELATNVNAVGASLPTDSRNDHANGDPVMSPSQQLRYAATNSHILS